MAAHVVSHLVQQAAQSGADFGNTAKWCVPPGTHLGDANPVFATAEWLTRILYAYDYVRSTASSGNQTTIETWLSNAGNYMRLNSDVDIVSNFYNSSETNFFNGTLNASGVTNSNTHWNSWDLYDGGPGVNQLAAWFNNRRGQMMGFYGQVGVMLNNTTMINWAKAWVREALKYHIYPGGAPNELYRSTDDNAPEAGWQYGSAVVGRMLDTADALARTGDYDLYNYSTTGGGLSAGSPAKTIQSACRFFVDTTEGTLVIYKPGAAHTTNYQMDGVLKTAAGDSANSYRVNEIFICKGNLFWEDNDFQTAYMNPGPANKLGETTIQDANRGWMGSGSVHPGMLFMWGQLEGLVDPYP